MKGILSFIPVGWGQFNTLKLDDKVVITDGGSKRKVWHAILHLHNLNLNDNESHWIISHLDHDHISITGSYIDNRNIDVDYCYLPGVLSYDACKKMVAMEMALDIIISSILRIPILPKAEIVKVILRRCKQRIGLFKGCIKPRFNSEVEYHIIWPDIECIKYCKKLCDKIHDYVEEFCKSIRYYKCMDTFEELSKEIYYELSEMELKKEAIKEKESISSEEYPLPEFVESCSPSTEEFMYWWRIWRYMGWRRIISEPQQLYELYDKYVKLKASYSNITSLAYALIIRRPVLNIRICVDNCSDSILFIRNSDASLLCRTVYTIYLSDLPSTSLNSALRYLYSSIKGGTNPIVPVAAHHGSYWSDMLNKMSPTITYISSTYPRKVNEGYLSLSPIVIMSGYDLKLEITF